MQRNGTQSGYFTYTDGNGAQVIVERLTDVPTKYRGEVRHFDLSAPAVKPAAPEARPAATQDAGKVCLGEETCLHVTSFLLGASIVVIIGTALFLFRKSSRALALLVSMGILVAMTVAVLTYVRRQAALPGKGLVTPKVLIDNARAAAKAVDDRHREQVRAIDEIGM